MASRATKATNEQLKAVVGLKKMLLERYPDIPQYTIHSLAAYIEKHKPTGLFLGAVLSNNFIGAIFNAGTSNLKAIRNIARLVHREVPYRAYGSQGKVASWIKNKESQKESQEG